ncbi:leucine--tRNA ligase [Candidatus Methylacidithermus pantelleriae]|nr:leucine--tRNA ligase [Candidatus Methylacidithermus pantelleriae]
MPIEFERTAFPFREYEPKWQRYWLSQGTFRAANPGEPGSEKPKFYVLDMFPYPSGSGLHVGHLEGYTASDVVARYKRMRGYNVLHPMGWDAFGLPAEQHAIQTGEHPRKATERNIANFRRQIQSMGFSYDWSREISTCDPRYYRWTQWIFLQLVRQGLAYVAEAPVWYCPALGTVLANEEVIHTESGPISERGGHPVERRWLKQWMLRITAYAERLLKDLDLLDWPESIKEMQRNWIGRSEGAEIVFSVEESGEEIWVFTTRPDTLLGATFVVLAPEHELVRRLTPPDRKEEVERYCQKAMLKSELERAELAREKTGVFLGRYAVHPVTGARLPIWVADYVVASYGTGAIMSVPGHDSRDYEFARRYGLPILWVVRPKDGELPNECYPQEGVAVNSAFLDGLSTEEAKEVMIRWLGEHGKGRRAVRYKLRDWLFSRQRYWGEPFPIVWKNGKPYPVDENQLPVELPELEDFGPSPEGLAPLSKVKDWVQLPDGSCREVNTMPQWAGSCWYYLRFCDPWNDRRFVSEEAERYWMNGNGVDLYIGGAEHAVLHLLYARFWHKVLYDLGLVSTPEPFHKLVNQGIILGEDGQKMSKSVGNIVNPDDLVFQYGADTVRLFELFLGPLEQTKPWSTRGLEGPHRFLARVWRLVLEETREEEWVLSSRLQDREPSPSLLRLLNQTIRKVTDDIEKLQFHTAIAQLMVLVNELTKEPIRPRSAVETLILLLSPFAPHIAEELWEKLGHKESLAYHPWPEADPKYLQEEEKELVVQVNGKLRGVLRVPVGISQKEAEDRARHIPAVERQLAQRAVRRVVYVPDRLINFVLESSDES